MTLREGDIESLKRKMKDEGRPIKTDVIRDGEGNTYHITDKKGRVTIRETT